MIDATQAALGSQANPHKIAPDDWYANGVEYGTWCVCSSCGRIGRSTFTFDFYADNPGDALKCEVCVVHTL